MKEWNWGSRMSVCVRKDKPFGMQSCGGKNNKKHLRLNKYIKQIFNKFP